MKPDTRIDLFISVRDPEDLPAGFATRDLLHATKEAVCDLAEKKDGALPSLFDAGTAVGDKVSAIFDAVLQTRPGGVALFLLTPLFFHDVCCVTSLRAFLQVAPNAKLRFVVLNPSEDLTISDFASKLIPELNNFNRRVDIPVKSVPETSALLAELVYNAWTGGDNDISPQYLPTILGCTQNESFLKLSNYFTTDYLSTLRACFDIPLRAATTVLDAFLAGRERRMINENNVDILHSVVIRYTGSNKEKQRKAVNAYERKWIDTSKLDWGASVWSELEALHSKSQIDNQRILASDSNAKAQSSRQTKRRKLETACVDTFCSYFDMPEIPLNIVLDYATLHENGEPVTVEGRLKREVIELSYGGEARPVSAVGIHGRSGVGKTTALRALSCEDEVKKAYPDGIYFLQFGQNTNDQKVTAEVKRCVTNSGGKAVAEQIERSDSLSRAIELASEWLRGRKMLLVCDNLWPMKSKLGDLEYVRLLKKVLQYARKSALLVSTRYKGRAESVGKAILFDSLAVRGKKARKILLKAAFSKQSESHVSNMYIDKLLVICDGLPLSLSIAGAAVKYDLCELGEASAIERYSKRLECRIGKNTNLLKYPRLSHVIEVSLDLCEQRQRNMRYYFKAFCVLETRVTIPISSLSRLWNVVDEFALKIAGIFRKVRLVLLEPCGSAYRLDDLVLMHCHSMMAEDERRSWHSKLCNSYIPLVAGVREWWRVEDDGYIMSNLSRHLVESGCASELQALLCDVRWLWRRKDTGGWIAWEMDFERLNGVPKDEKQRDMEHLRSVCQSWFSGCKESNRCA